MEESILYVRNQGAAGDGKTKDTEIIQNCIDQCSQAGGGTVVLERGVYVCGTLYLRSNITLEIRKSAVLLASPDIGDYGTDTHYNRYKNEHDMDRCWLYAEDAENISITGEGELNGSAAAFPNAGSIYRPMMMRFLRCRNLILRNLRLTESAAWTAAFLDSSCIRAENLTIRNRTNYNGDGLDFDGCSQVFVQGCVIEGTDDNLCLQAGSREFPTENIHISGCSFTSLCAGIRIGLKSIGMIRDVVISNCTMRNVWREGIKIECSEGGEISNIAIQNIVMRNVSRPLFVILNNRYQPEGLGSSLGLDHVPEVGRLERVSVQNLLAADDAEMKHPHLRFGNDLMGAPWFNGIRFDVAQGHYINDVTLENIRYQSIGGVKKSDIPAEYPILKVQEKAGDILESGNYEPAWSRAAFMDIRGVRGLALSNVGFESLEPDERVPYILENCETVKEEVIIRERR